MAADGTIEPQTINYAPKASALQAKSGKDAQEVQAQYYGPPVNNLDAELQLLLERYLEDRGINTELANFLPDYVEYKEQKEYVSWLQSKWNACLHICGYNADHLNRLEEVHRHLNGIQYLVSQDAAISR